LALGVARRVAESQARRQPWPLASAEAEVESQLGPWLTSAWLGACGRRLGVGPWRRRCSQSAAAGAGRRALAGGAAGGAGRLQIRFSRTAWDVRLLGTWAGSLGRAGVRLLDTWVWARITIAGLGDIGLA
jgi:hypothetical protein